MYMHISVVDMYERLISAVPPGYLKKKRPKFRADAQLRTHLSEGTKSGRPDRPNRTAIHAAGILEPNPCPIFWSFGDDFGLNYPLVMTNIAVERSTIFKGTIHYKWSFSVAMLNYERVLACTCR